METKPTGIQQLQEELEAAPVESIGLFKIQKLPYETWSQYGFYDEPESKALVYEFNDGPICPQRCFAKCSFLSVTARNPEVAIKALRADLELLDRHFRVVAFLAKPSLVEFDLPPREGEQPDAMMRADLPGAVPGDQLVVARVKGVAAFCFFYAYQVVRKPLDGNGWSLEIRPVTDDMLRAAGLMCVSAEGGLGRRLD